MITDPDEYFARGCGRCARFGTEGCASRLWAEGLETLRDLCLCAGLSEQAKWGHPCYMAHGRNVAIIGAFRSDFRLSFFDAALLPDPHRLLERQGSATQHPDMIRFRANRIEAQTQAHIAEYLEVAIAVARSGARAPKPLYSHEFPAELQAVLDKDPEYAAAFAALTPGRQRSYLIDLGRAKKPETRLSRALKYRDKVLSGKGQTER